MSVGAAPLKLGDAALELCSIGEAEALLARPASPGEWLSPGEQRTLLGLATSKRKRDWLAARVAAKRLLGARLGRPAPQIEILNAPTREPYVALDGKRAPELPISLSHGADLGGCALAPAGTLVGMDLERIEARDASWPALMATDEELSSEALASPESLTRLWTVKEAVLKLLGLGLSVDMRSVRPQGSAVELFGKSLDAWKSLGSPRLSLVSTRHEGCCISVALGRPAHGPVEDRHPKGLSGPFGPGCSGAGAPPGTRR